jgi:hypothetical protein
MNSRMPIWILVALLLAALVCSCAGCATAPGLNVQPTAQIVKVPVITPCIDKLPAAPTFMTDAELLDGSDYQVVLNLRIDRDQRRKYEAETQALLAACVK